MATITRPVLLACLTAACYHANAQDNKPVTKQSFPSVVVTGSFAQPWQSFQVDEHLTVNLPGPPRLIPIPAVTKHIALAYLAENKDAIFLIMRAELTGPEAAGMTSAAQDVLYTSLTQSTLTTMHALRVSQASFHTGKFEGLAVQFRGKDSSTGQPNSGTMWALRAGTSVYLLQFIPKNADAPESSSQQAQFLASLAANDAPYTPPTATEWARFKVGHFRYLDPALRAATVERTDTIQTEVDASRGLRIVYRLYWTAEGYELRQLSSTAPHAAAMQDKPIRVRITAVNGDTYSYQSNLEGIIFTGKIERVEN